MGYSNTSTSMANESLVRVFLENHWIWHIDCLFHVFGTLSSPPSHHRVAYCLMPLLCRTSNAIAIYIYIVIITFDFSNNDPLYNRVHCLFKRSLNRFQVFKIDRRPLQFDTKSDEAQAEFKYVDSSVYSKIVQRSKFTRHLDDQFETCARSEQASVCMCVCVCASHVLFSQRQVDRFSNLFVNCLSFYLRMQHVKDV